MRIVKLNVSSPVNSGWTSISFWSLYFYKHCLTGYDLELGFCNIPKKPFRIELNKILKSYHWNGMFFRNWISTGPNLVFFILIVYYSDWAYSNIPMLLLLFIKCLKFRLGLLEYLFGYSFVKILLFQICLSEYSCITLWEYVITI